MISEDDLEERLQRAGLDWRSTNGITPAPMAGVDEAELTVTPMRRHRPVLAMAATVAAVLAIVGGGLIWRNARTQNQTVGQSSTGVHRGTTPSSASVDPNVLIRLRAVAAESAKSNHGRVTVAEAVKTTHARAELLMDGSTSSNGDPNYGAAAVWLIEVRGQFVCGACKVPPGAKMPAGGVLSLIVTADTYEGTDFGIGGSSLLDLASLGPVVSLVDPGVLTKLRAAAAAADEANGGGRYTAEAVLVPGDQAPVVSAQPGSQNDNALVWLLQLQRRFTGTYSPGAAKSSGPVIIEALDTTTYGVDTFGIGRTTPVDLGPLGPVVTVVG